MDESPNSQGMYADCFRHYGFAVAEAGNREDAVRLYHQLQPDLVITELSSDPEWVEAIRTVRGGEVGGTTAIIACSTTIDARWPRVPAGIDVDVALGKPISPLALLQEVENLLKVRADEATEALV